jgi:hypothetical protein
MNSFAHLSQYGVIIYQDCKIGVLYEHSDAHLANKKHHLPPIRRKQIQQEIAIWPNILRNETDLD